jgi:hypothetical protein
VFSSPTSSASSYKVGHHPGQSEPKLIIGIFLALLRVYYVRQNRKRDRLLAEGQLQNRKEDEFADKTDLELPGFRYVVSGDWPSFAPAN